MNVLMIIQFNYKNIMKIIKLTIKYFNHIPFNFIKQ